MRWENTPKIICGVKACVGGGLEIAMACDISIAKKRRQSRSGGNQLGVMPAMGAPASAPPVGKPEHGLCSPVKHRLREALNGPGPRHLEKENFLDQVWIATQVVVPNKALAAAKSTRHHTALIILPDGLVRARTPGTACAANGRKRKPIGEKNGRRKFNGK